MIVPLRAILFQLLFLFIAIAVEAFIFQERLKINRRASLEYAASINLFSAAIGWIIFFCIEPLLPNPLKSVLISYVLFSVRSSSVNTLLILLGLLIFFGTFIIELQGLELLRLLLKEQIDTPVVPPKVYKYRSKIQRRELSQVANNRATTILLANACSYSVILLILIARSLEGSFPGNG